MHDPSAIFFQTEFEFLPIEELKFDKAMARCLYTVLARGEAHAYDDIEMRPDQYTLSALRGEVRSACRIEPHSITIEERKPNFPVDDFIAIEKAILAALQEANSKCPPLFLQRTRIQCLSQPSHTDGAPDLLASGVANVYDKIGPFERAPSFFGVRFRFLPSAITGSSDDEDEDIANDDSDEDGASGFVSLRFETYSEDTNLVWAEVACMHIVEPQADIEVQDDVTRLGQTTKATYDFLTKKAIGFLNQFDRPKNGEQP